MISKELLSEVLENEVPYQVKVHKIIIKNNSLNYFYNSKDNRGGLFEANEYINIYELANKCKEWATGEHGFSLHSFLCPDDTCTCEIYKFHKSTGYVFVDWFNCLSEVEAIFKACEYIMENKCGS